MAYERINWKDYPDKTTPVNANNLNKMDTAIKEHDVAIGDTSEIADIGDGTIAGAIASQNSSLVNVNKALPVIKGVACHYASAYTLYGSVAHDYAVGTYKAFAEINTSGLTQNELLGESQLTNIFVNPSDKIVEIYVKGTGLTTDSGANVDVALIPIN